MKSLFAIPLFLLSLSAAAQTFNVTLRCPESAPAVPAKISLPDTLLGQHYSCKWTGRADLTATLRNINVVIGGKNFVADAPMRASWVIGDRCEYLPSMETALKQYADNGYSFVPAYARLRVPGETQSIELVASYYTGASGELMEFHVVDCKTEK
jgi:hypothetical protein